MAMEPLLPQLMVGLGNPGARYAGTRHNVGFLTIDRLLTGGGAEDGEVHRCDCWLYRLRAAGRQLYLAKPQTFMNLSGAAVGKLQRALEVSPRELLIIYDDLDLPLGRLRLRRQGGSAGHKGMQSIIDELGTERIPRLRIGIGRQQPENSVVEHVLSDWAEDELAAVQATIGAAAEAVLCAARRGLTVAMDTYNRWRLADVTPQVTQTDREIGH